MSSKKRNNLAVELARATRIPSRVNSEAALRFFTALDCSKSLQAAILLRYGEIDQLVSLSCNPNDYNTPQSFRDAYLACEFLSKSEWLKTTFDKEKLAIEKFFSLEDRCLQVNRRFRMYAGKSTSFDQGERDSEWYKYTQNSMLLDATRRKISSILGSFDAEELFSLSSWGPGVSLHITGEETFGAKKFQSETGITRDLLPLVKGLLPFAYPGWAYERFTSSCPFTPVIGNKIITVPKSSKIDRVIAVEPGINIWFQLGLGKMLRRRLGRFGVFPADQTRNQRAAKLSSINDSLATVDFSSASDTIASEVIESLFPTQWFQVMDLLRSKYGSYKGQDHRWEKFSSMGNGFTFDLETLVFYAMACACCSMHKLSVQDISVVGDDVILPTAAYDTFSSFSDFLGFIINPKKSFAHGCFRESCGSHYYLGVDCKPVYFKKKLASIQEVYNFGNTIRLRAKLPYGCDARFKGIFYWLQSLVPKKLRYKVSASVDSFGLISPTQGGFISNFDEATPTRARNGLEGYTVEHLTWIPVKVSICYPGLLFSRLSSGCSQLSEGNNSPLRGRTRMKVSRILHNRWVDLGPWI
jgi:hypothetical protein